MRLRTVFLSLSVLLTTLGGAYGQEKRVVCVLVDDLEFGISDQESSARLLAIVRDELLTDADLVGFVSTGPSSVTADLRDASDRPRLERIVARLSNVGSNEPRERRDRSWDTARIGVGTAADVVRNLARLPHRDKRLLIITSAPAPKNSLEAAFTGGRGVPVPSDIAGQLAEMLATATDGNVTIRTVSTGDPGSAAVLRAFR